MTAPLPAGSRGDLVETRLRALRDGTVWEAPALGIDWQAAHDSGLRRMEEFLRSSRGEALAEGLAWLESALVTAAPGEQLSQTLGYYSQSVRMYREWLSQHGRRAEERSANERFLAAAQAALALAESAGDDPVFHQLQVASALRTRAALEHQAADLDTAISLVEGALARMTSFHPDHLTALNILGNALAQRFDTTGDLADIDRAIALQRDAVRRLHAREPGGAAFRRSLARSLSTRARRTGLPEDFDAAIDLYDQALAGGVHLGNDGPATANLVGGLRYDRFAVSGNLVDLELARARFEQALAAAPCGDPNLPWYLRNLALALTEGFAITGDAISLDRAIELHRQAVALVPRVAVERTSFLELLGRALLARDARAADPASLDEAVALLEEALATSGDAPRAEALATLARILFRRGSRNGVRADLDRAVGLASRAVGLGGGRGMLARASALAARYDAGGPGTDRDAARASFRAACDAERATPLPSVLEAATHWGDWATRHADWAEAAEAYTRAIGAARLLAATQLEAHAHLARLDRAGPLAGRAAYALARLGRNVDALLVLEQGRARLIAQALEGETAELDGVDRATRARFREAAARLRPLRLAPLTGARLGEREARHVLAEFDAALAKVRQVAGHERFLLSPEADDLHLDRLAEPVVFLVAAPAGGLALVAVAADAVRAVWLPDLTDQAVRDRVQPYLDAYQARTADPAAWARAIDDLTRWAWEAAMGPLLDALAPAPRLRIVPTGLLALVPLHAAWRPEGAGRHYAGDQVLTTYSPALRLSEKKPADPDHLLVITAPPSEQAPELPFVAAEAQAACAAFPGRYRVLAHGATSPQGVRGNLTGHGALHLACHGVARLADPLASGLLLARDETLTLAEILKVGALRARLAVFSACETAMGGTVAAEEAINLPAAILQTGVTGAVGSLWAVPDRATALLMAAFYDQWPGREPDPAVALRSAQQWLRDSDNATKLERFPDLLRDTYDRLPPAAGRLWLSARSHGHPYHWAAFGLWGR